jgi:cell division septation protein DedD
MVQVGAIGNRKDAERLVAELRKKGFHAAIYPEKHDKFLHVQIGPFKDFAQAQSKRHQVMASGFHAILKSTS